MLLANTLLSFTTIVAFLLGLFIFISNPKKPVNRALAGLVFSAFLWMFTNLLTNTSSNESRALFFARTTIIGPALLTYLFLIFVYTFIPNITLSLKKALVLGVLPLVIIVTFPSRFNIQSIESYGRNTVAGPIYYVLLAAIIIYFGKGFQLLYGRYKITKSQTERAQIRYIYAGSILALVPATVMNAILPILGYPEAVFYGPNFILLLAIFLAIAIIKHRFLDIRLIVARSLAYILLFIAMVGLYALIVLGVTERIFGSDSEPYRRYVPVLTVIILGLLLPYLRTFFDRITNSLFYRDAYDTQGFLDALNKELVSNIDLESLLTRSSEIIKSNLKPDFCFFGIRETEYSPQRTIGTSRKEFNDEDIATIRKLTAQAKHTVIVADELEEDNLLKKLMRKYDIAILSRLATDLNLQKTEALGSLVLGEKKSGNPYNSQDIKMVEIITNELVIAIQNALRFEEIEKFNITLQERVDNATAQLRRSNNKLKEMDETKDEFISMASHQLRTPLTSVKGYLSMVLEGDAGKITTQQRKLLNQAFISSQRMVYLIADLLNVSRLKTGKFIIESQPTNLADLVEGEVAQLQEVATGRNLELKYNKPKDVAMLNLDETKIRQVVMNFIDNAIYYTPAGGHITVAVRETPETVEFKVVDDGLGVPKHEQHNLFTKFYRAANAKKARPDGTGLGLFMAKKVIIAQGGSIIFSSQENKGSTFGFAFAKAKLKVPERTATIKETVKV